MRANPGGVRLALETRYAKYAELDANGAAWLCHSLAQGRALLAAFLEHGYAPLPEFEKPRMGPVARPDLAARFPMVLTSAKATLFCQT